MTPLHHTCLHKCAQSRTLNRQLKEVENYHKIATLLINKAKVMLAKDNMMNTALHLAADEGCLEITRSLLDNAGDSLLINNKAKVMLAKDNMMNTALHLAADEGCLEITRSLLDNAGDCLQV